MRTGYRNLFLHGRGRIKFEAYFILKDSQNQLFIKVALKNRGQLLGVIFVLSP